MLKTIAMHLTLAALTIAAVASLPTINAKAQYNYQYRYNSSGQQTYGQHYGR